MKWAAHGRLRCPDPAVGTPFGKDWQFFEGEITKDNISSMYELLQLFVEKVARGNLSQVINSNQLLNGQQGTCGGETMFKPWKKILASQDTMD